MPTPPNIITILEKIELCAHRAAHKFEKGTREFDILKILAHELMKMQKEVRDDENKTKKE